jgi:hypothetical protein
VSDVRDDAHCGSHGMHCVVHATSQQWPPMPSDTERVLPVRPGMGKWRHTWHHGVGVHRGPATNAVGPTQSLTFVRRLALVGGRDYSCKRVVVASCEWVAVVEVRDGGEVKRTATYSETECSCHTGRQVLGCGGIFDSSAGVGAGVGGA